VSWLVFSGDTRAVVGASTLAGILAGALAGLASYRAPHASSPALLAALYIAGLAYVVYALRRLRLSRVLEGVVAYTSLFLGVWVSVYNAMLP